MKDSTEYVILVFVHLENTSTRRAKSVKTALEVLSTMDTLAVFYCPILLFSFFGAYIINLCHSLFNVLCTRE